jgi:hypothetical protein
MKRAVMMAALAGALLLGFASLDGVSGDRGTGVETGSPAGAGMQVAGAPSSGIEWGQIAGGKGGIGGDTWS